MRRVGVIVAVPLLLFAAFALGWLLHEPRHMQHRAIPPARPAPVCPHITYGANGSAGPLFCNDGSPNPPVLSFYRGMGLMVLQLGADADPGVITRAMCLDMWVPGSTYPIEDAAYALAARVNHWQFGVPPTDQYKYDSGGCDELKRVQQR